MASWDRTTSLTRTDGQAASSAGRFFLGFLGFTLILVGAGVALYTFFFALDIIRQPQHSGLLTTILGFIKEGLSPVPSGANATPLVHAAGQGNGLELTIGSGLVLLVALSLAGAFVHILLSASKLLIHTGLRVLDLLSQPRVIGTVQTPAISAAQARDVSPL